ncbi:MAG: hypothetical protein Q4C13_05330, partial [Clostridia bacterium]|nr:hypothetical protein [Clostridia bacterium]
MKKLLALLLCLCMVFAAVACQTASPVEPEVTEAPAAAEPAEDDGVVASPATYAGNDGGFTVSPIYFYTNMYCLHEGIENLMYTQFGYYFFTYATGKEDINACIASEPET